MKVLLTGAGGFIGKYLEKELLEQGFFLRSVFRSGRVVENPLLDNLSGYKDKYETVFIESLDNQTNWKPFLEDIDYVIHLAGKAHDVFNVSDPSEYFVVNTQATQRLAESSALAKVKKFVFVSSSLVHGTTSIEPFSEKSALAPYSPYTSSKVEAEKRLEEISVTFGLPYIIIRPPLVYGKLAAGNFARLKNLVKTQIPLPLKTVTNKRSFIYVENLTDIIIQLVLSNMINQTYLVSDDEDVSTPMLLKKIAGVSGVSIYLFPCPISVLRFVGKITGRTRDIDRLTESFVLDIRKLKTDLGWKPKFSLEEGLKRSFILKNEKIQIERKQ
jgi:nucleoside-diphosphate-sugar epimerase